MIELPSFPIETKPYAIYAEGEREGVGGEGFRYPCVAYLRSATMNSGVDPRCLQVLINRQGGRSSSVFRCVYGNGAQSKSSGFSVRALV